jgi:hypothetical protein
VRIFGATTTASWVNPWCILFCLAQHHVYDLFYFCKPKDMKQQQELRCFCLLQYSL